MRYMKLGGLAVLLAMLSGAATQTTEDKFAAQPIKYADLGKLIRSHRGKVILVDFWSLG